MKTEYEDASGYKGWVEEYHKPTSEDEISAILRQASATATPVTVVGGLTGLTGGAAASGGWAISTEKMLKLEIHGDTAVCGPGVRLQALQAKAKESGQFFAPDPTEWLASIGGAIANNSSGSRSFLYGPVSNHVRALRVAFADGSVRAFRRGDPVDFEIPLMQLPNVRKNVAGYRLRPGMDWIDLICGSEGTLGVVTEAELQLLPNPEELLSGVIFFGSDEKALDAVDAWRGVAGLRMLEYCDGPSLQMVGNPHAAALLIEQIVTDDVEIEQWQERLEAAGARVDDSWIAASDQDRERFRKFRHSMPETVIARVRRNGVMKVGSDFAVPLEKNREMICFYREKLDAAMPGLYVIYGHIGDGHVHVNIMPENAAQFEQAEHMMHVFAEHAVKLGGTVSAEHGLGKRKSKFLKLQYSEEELDAMRAVKKRLDPQWLLGQGTLFRQV